MDGLRVPTVSDCTVTDWAPEMSKDGCHPPSRWCQQPFRQLLQPAGMSRTSGMISDHNADHSSGNWVVHNPVGTTGSQQRPGTTNSTPLQLSSRAECEAAPQSLHGMQVALPGLGGWMAANSSCCRRASFNPSTSPGCPPKPVLQLAEQSATALAHSWWP